MSTQEKRKNTVQFQNKFYLRVSLTLSRTGRISAVGGLLLSPSSETYPLELTLCKGAVQGIGKLGSCLELHLQGALINSPQAKNLR